MTKFRFRLETLHRLREMNRDELRVRLAEAIQAEQIVGAQRQELLREAAALAAARREQFAAGSPADRQVRVLDKLRERRAAQHAVAQNAADAKRLDEIATTRWEPNRR
jgi:flagellar biosynthesis chaperone FliJ